MSANTDSTLYDANAYTDKELMHMLEFSTDSINTQPHSTTSVAGTNSVAIDRAETMISKYGGIANDSSLSNDQRNEASLIKQFFENVKARFVARPNMPALPYDESVASISASTISQYGTPTQIFNTTDKQNMNNMMNSGVLNPLPIHTITRVISIDSRFRDTKNYPRSTDFTCTLTETLRNVLSLKLYFYHIPYMWYTVGSTFGNNFIYLISTTPGLDAYAIKISIEPGKYTETSLCAAINSSIYKLYAGTAPLYADIYFEDATESAVSGLTTESNVITGTFMQYNSVTTNVKWWTKMSLQYNAASFYVSFPGTVRSATLGIATNLGELFGMEAIIPESGVRNFEARTIRSTVIATDDATTFPITATNSYITINYIVSTTDESLNKYNYLSLDLIGQIYDGTDTITAGGEYTRSQLTNALTQLIDNSNASSFTDSTHILSSVSALTKIDVNIINTNYIYELTLELNRKYVNNHVSHPDYKDAYITVGFPTVSNTIWTGADSCFRFVQSSTKPSDIISISPTAYLKYTLSTNLKLYFRCTNVNWKNDDTNTVNDFNIQISDTAIDYGDIISFTTGINSAIATSSASYNRVATITSPQNITISAIVDSGINYNTLSVIPKLTVSILRQVVATESGNFTLTLASNPSTEPNNIWSWLGIPTLTTTTNYVYANATVYYTTSGDTSAIATDLLDLLSTPLFLINYTSTDIPSLNGKTFTVSGNSSTSTFDTTIIYNNRTALANAFKEYITKPLSINDSAFETAGGSILASIEVNDITAEITLTVKLSISLTEKDYSVFFLDGDVPSVLDTAPESSTTSWKNYFNFPNWTDLNNTNTTNITSNNSSTSGVCKALTPISVAMMFLTSTDLYFYVRVSADVIGLSTNTESTTTPSIYYNDYKIDLSTIANTSIEYTDANITVSGYLYTHAAVISAINTAFTNINDLKNSVITIETSGQDITLHRTILALSVSRIFTHTEFSAVFFSAEYFSSCAQANSLNPYLNMGTSRYSTLGWVLGFQNETETALTDDNYITPNTPLNIRPNTYLTLILTDYVQSSIATHGMITILPPEYSSARPSYSLYTTLAANSAISASTDIDCIFANSTFRNTNSTNSILTNAGIFASNQVKVSTTNNNYSTRVSEAYSKDAFAVIPVNPTNDTSVFMDYSQSLQSQERVYFGPVNLSRFSVQLRTSAGDLLDLNNANWGFAILAKVAYN
jgi:hypothetical protein